MRLSHRLAAIPEPAGDAWAIYHRAREMRRAGIDVVMLSVGDHDHRTPDSILDAMRNSARAGHTGYTPALGTPGLRATIAARESAATGHPVTPEEVGVTTGAQMALFNACLAVLDPGDRMVIVDPYYATYPLTVRAAGGVPVPVRANPDAGFQLDQAVLEQAAQGAKAILINSPNNPTGAVYSAATLAGVAEVATAEDLWVISDEVYGGQVWEGQHVSPRSLPGMAARTIVVGSMSKSHIMTGSRVGWMVAPAALIEALSHVATVTTYGAPGYAQDASEQALREGFAIESEVRETYARRRAAALPVLAGSNRLRVSPPQGGMYLMIDIRPTGQSALSFATTLLEQDHVAVMPGEGFGAAAVGHLRVALTAPDDQLTDALSRLRAMAEAA